MPGTELGGVEVTAWREDGALQVDVLLDDADGTAWKLDVLSHEVGYAEGPMIS